MKSYSLACLAFLFVGCAGLSSAAFPQTLESSPRPQTGPREAVFISDLHLGLGRTEQDQKGAWVVGAWHPMEDFRWQQQFDAFLSNLEGRAKRTGVPIDLIILGDFLELWQTPWPPSDCIYNKQGKVISPAKAKNIDVQKDWSCTEADALKRLQRVLGAHATTLTHLKRFAESGDNRLTIVIGNHDAALIYPRIAAATLAAIGSSPERVRIASEGYWHSADGQIFAEHGHFLENDVNIYDVLPASCLALNNRQASCEQQGVFLRRPWGEQFVQRYYNQFEETYSVIDNMTSEWYGVKLAVAEAGASEALTAVRDGFRFLLLHESPSQLVSLLGESDRTLGGGGGQGGWDIKTIREKTGDRFLVESLDSDDPLHAAAEQALAQNELNFSVKDLSDEEIITVCNMRAARREAARLAGKPAPVDDCPGRERLGAIKTAILNTSAQRLSHRLDQVRKTLPDADRPTKDFSLYVYAHTHSEHGECRPKEVVTKGLIGQDTWNPGAVNTGAWQRLITPETFNQMKKSSKKTLDQFGPEDLPACFSVIVVPAYQANSNAKPRPKLLFWSQEDESQNWDLHEYCSSDKGRAKRDPCM